MWASLRRWAIISRGWSGRRFPGSMRLSCGDNVFGGDELKMQGKYKGIHMHDSFKVFSYSCQGLQ